MAKTSKTYRGQVRNKYRDHVGCGCFLCTGKDRSNQYIQKEKEDLKEVNEIINNFCLHNVSNTLKCGSETYFDEEENEAYCVECGKCV